MVVAGLVRKMNYPAVISNLLPAHCGSFHLHGCFVPHIFLNSLFNQVNEWRENDGHGEFINIIYQAYGQHELPAPVIAQLKRYEQ